jgi:hypothetical protein
MVLNIGLSQLDDESYLRLSESSFKKKDRVYI